MFQQTKIRLTLLNSLVVILLISILGTVFYTYAYNKLYRDVDNSLLRMTDLIRNQGLGFPVPRMMRDPRVDILIWDQNNQLVSPHPQSIFNDNKSHVLLKNKNTLQDIEVDQFHFRTIAIPVKTDVGPVTIQLVRNIDSEKDMLDKLLLIVVLGCCIGSILAVASGFFLAGRALIPITNAWDKQQQFVSDASHELRTPLSVIQSRMELMLQTPKATIEEKAMDASVILKECRRLSRLVKNLLTLARSDSNQMELKKTAFSLDELLKEISGHYSEIASFQGKTIKLDVGSPILFFGDRERFHQLVVILLDNAMKFTNEGGEILLSCKKNSHSIQLIVQDNGIGIQKESLPKIFDRFYQENKARTTEEGLGLGLSIAQWIIEKHQGKINVQSKPGEGTVFEMNFPFNNK